MFELATSKALAKFQGSVRERLYIYFYEFGLRGTMEAEQQQAKISTTVLLPRPQPKVLCRCRHTGPVFGGKGLSARARYKPLDAMPSVGGVASYALQKGNWISIYAPLPSAVAPAVAPVPSALVLTAGRRQEGQQLQLATGQLVRNRNAFQSTMHSGRLRRGLFC
jgi:hypothetical protein